MYPARVVINLLDRYEIDDRGLCTPVSIWATSMAALFRPQIEFLLHARDQVLGDQPETRALPATYEDERLEITSMIEIDIDRQIAAVDRAFNGIPHPHN